MDKNLDLIAKELFSKIRTQVPKVRLGDANSEVTDRPSDARYFEFDYSKHGKNLGTVTISLSDDPEDDGAEGLVVIFSNDIVSDVPEHISKEWYRFLESLSDFASSHMLDFHVRDIAKNNLEKRDYKFLAKKSGEGAMTESKLYGTSKTSFQELGEAKLIVKHTQPVNYNLPAGRTQHIESIYIESAEGERFKYPFKHLNGARALAMHVAHGGNSYDDIGQHIISLSEELSKLRMFKGYVDRHPLIAEAMDSVNSKVYERIDQVKKEIANLQRATYYEQFAESFTKKEERLIPEDLINDWVERLTIRSFNEELKNVFPYIYNLVGEDIAPVIELSADDLLGEANLSERATPEWLDKVGKAKQLLAQGMTVDQVGKAMGVQGPNHGMAGTMGSDWGAINYAAREVNKPKPTFERHSVLNVEENYEAYLNSIVDEESALFNVQDSQADAIQQLNDLVSQEMPVGADGTNAIQSLKDIIDDEELNDVFRELGQVDPDMDAREIIKSYLQKKDEENGTDVASKINFGSSTPAEPPAEEPAPAPEAPAAAAPEAPAAPVAESSFERAIRKAAAAGATVETMINLGGKEISIGEAITKAGYQVEQFFESKSENQVVEFIKSMYDESTGRFPKGETGVMIAVEKEFGEDAVSVAKHVISELSTMYESTRLRQLAGLV